MGLATAAETSAFSASPGFPEFLTRYPDYRATGALDRLRATEYRHLDVDGHVYLDYAGAGVPARSQVEAHRDRLVNGCYGNPHSDNPSSVASTRRVAAARRAVLAHFNADPAEYAVIFTANATAACRLVGEAYPFRRGRRLVLTADNHNSVVGLRRFAHTRHARTAYVPFADEMRIAGRDVAAILGAGTGPPRRGTRRGLFAYPAQSNFTGVRHPLEWVALARQAGYDVLLDAAAYLPTARLDLSVVQPDFVPVSWYKLFGHPTGLGCLVARWATLRRLARPWFAGGTVTAVSVLGDWHALADDESSYEDGTLNFLSVPDVEIGLSWLDRAGWDVIGARVRCLTGWFLDRLTGLRHSDGGPMAVVYGPADTRARGGTVAFNLLDRAGALIDERAVAAGTAARGFSVRTGCFCNPGAGEATLGLTRRALRGFSVARTRTLDDFLRAIGAPVGGAVRVSFGPPSTFDDVQRFLAYLWETFRDIRADPAGLPPRARC